MFAETALNDCSKTVSSLNNVIHREITEPGVDASF